MSTTPRHGLADLLAIMARLRDPERGCPWDIQQDFSTIAPYTIEEAYEVSDAIDRHDWNDLRDELGDLLLQVVFHSQMAKEQDLFAFDDVVQAISEKMLRRHPHVFGDVAYADVEEQKRAWEDIKADERAAKGESRDESVLAGVSSGQPAWQRATKLQQRAATVGFDWPDYRPVIEKLQEELTEVADEFDAGADPDRLEDEIGDVMFVAVNLARHARVDVMRALKRANAKFEWRFRRMEQLAAAQGRPLSALDLAAQEALWRQAKAEER